MVCEQHERNARKPERAALSVEEREKLNAPKLHCKPDAGTTRRNNEQKVAPQGEGQRDADPPREDFLAKRITEASHKAWQDDELRANEANSICPDKPPVREGDLTYPPYVGVGGGTTAYRKFFEATSSAISHPAADSTTPTRGITRDVPQQPARTSKPGPGTATWELNPSDPSVAIRDMKAAAIAGAVRSFREDEGELRSVRKNTAGTMVAVATTGVITLSGTPADPGTNLLPKAPWDRGLILVVGTQAIFLDDFDTGTATTIQGSYLGPVASGVVSPVAPSNASGPTPLPSAVAATATWELVEYAIRREFSGKLTTVPGHSTSADSRTMTIEVQLDGFETESYLVA